MEKELCLHCGGNNIQNEVEVITSQNHVVGAAGKGIMGIFGKFPAAIPFACDLCLDCGTVSRFYVVRTDKEFVSGVNRSGIRFTNG